MGGLQHALGMFILLSISARLTRVQVTLQETANEINKIKSWFLLVYTTVPTKVERVS
jgi:hypothetical protein